jgi:hypothetical protein
MCGCMATASRQGWQQATVPLCTRRRTSCMLRQVRRLVGEIAWQGLIRVLVLAGFGKRVTTWRTKLDPFTITFGIDGTGLVAARNWWTLQSW